MSRPASSVASGLARSTRPRQWIKNLLVLAAPVAAGRIGEPAVLLPTLSAAAAFCMAAAAGYLLNDVIDRDYDRRHPQKRFRPIAAGVVTPRQALVTALALAAAGLLLAAATDVGLVLVIGVYLALQGAYCLRWKHEPVLDLAVVASGFLLRAVAGGVAADIPFTTSFLLVSGFGSLFIVAGKRASEMDLLGADASTRRALVRYSPSYLRFVWTLAGTATVLSYAMWALQQPESGAAAWHGLSVAPFVLGVLRYAVDIDAARAGAPEEIIWRDRVLQALGAVWVLLLLLGIFDG